MKASSSEGIVDGIWTTGRSPITSWTDTKFTKEETARALSMMTLPYLYQHERAKNQPQEPTVSYFFKHKTK
uniref:hypothetical protein n=1 Tax=Spirosoma sp. TaxID=1899569 RepID=UPI003B3A68FF